MAKVQHGKVVLDDIKDIVAATEAKKKLVAADNNFTYEIVGVYGNYKIVQRDRVATETRYAD